MSKSPRQELNEREKGNPDGHYGTNYSFILLIESRLKQQSSKILKSIDSGTLWNHSDTTDCY